MKKYLLGIFAIVLAIGFSAFTTSNTAKKDSKMVNYYWYQVEGGQISESDPVFETEVSRAYAVENGPCLTGTDADCLWAFDELITSFPVTSDPQLETKIQQDIP